MPIVLCCCQVHSDQFGWCWDTAVWSSADSEACQVPWRRAYPRGKTSSTSCRAVTPFSTHSAPRRTMLCSELPSLTLSLVTHRLFLAPSGFCREFITSTAVSSWSIDCGSTVFRFSEIAESRNCCAIVCYFQLLTIFVTGKIKQYMEFYNANKDFVTSLGN